MMSCLILGSHKYHQLSLYHCGKCLSFDKSIADIFLLYLQVETVQYIQCDQMESLFLQYLGIYSNENLHNRIEKFPK